MSVEAARPGAILQARGSLDRDPAIVYPPQLRRVRLLVELGLLFVLAPLFIRYLIFGLGIPLPLALQPVLLGFILYLLWDRTFWLRREVMSGFSFKVLSSILMVFAAVAITVTVFVYEELNGRFLRLPREYPAMWAFIMVMYPIMSVIPQELVYRTFFFHRYGPLFGGARVPAIIVNGLLFGFAHVMFGSYISIALTAMLGCLLAWRYLEARSFWAVWLEHSLYGCMVFTVGLGHYFFTGVANIR